MSSKEQRKKNPFDPLINPVKLFRRDKSEAAKVGLSDFQKRIGQKHSALK